jgi:hypothetical protein
MKNPHPKPKSLQMKFFFLIRVFWRSEPAFQVFKINSRLIVSTVMIFIQMPVLPAGARSGFSNLFFASLKSQT